LRHRFLRDQEIFMKNKFLLLTLATILAVPHIVHAEMASMKMTGMYGPYSMAREASGTSWQPDSTPHEGLHFMKKDWMLMVHGFATALYDHQGGDRGDDKFISTNMLMVMAQRPVGMGTLGLRSMLSLDPATVGKNGYPLLLQTGETANGRDPLIDRQHPHDLFMELAASYSLPVGQDGSIFGYLGYPGEPALGPATFMHRFSGMEIPEAPITHHWLDATHITFGVLTAGYIWKSVKVEGSRFTGREPNQYRWDFDKARFDSSSARLSFNPTKNWAFQTSYGRIKSPEQLEPDIDQDRTTASASYNRAWSMNNWQSTFAWGRNKNKPGHTLDGLLVESTLALHKMHTFFGRFENVEKDELFEAPDPRTGTIYRVNKLSAGYIYDFLTLRYGQIGIGGLGSIHFLPNSLDTVYGKTPLSYMLFVRAKLGSSESHEKHQNNMKM
jgi:hypothetical protein